MSVALKIGGKRRLVMADAQEIIECHCHDELTLYKLSQFILGVADGVLHALYSFPICISL